MLDIQVSSEVGVADRKLNVSVKLNIGVPQIYLIEQNWYFWVSDLKVTRIVEEVKRLVFDEMAKQLTFWQVTIKTNRVNFNI